MCKLRANGCLINAPRRFTFTSLWQFDPDKQQWTEVLPRLSCSAEITPTKTGDQFLLRLTDEIGLFWTWYEEDGKKTGTLVYSGAVLPNDLMIGPPKKGFIVSGIPSKDHATVAYVPDPRLHCSWPQKDLVTGEMRLRIPGASQSDDDNSHPMFHIHTVKKGEGLSVIAHKYNVSVRDIVKWNDIRNPN